MADYVYPFHKMNYIQGDRPDVPCILCAIYEKNPKVTSLNIYESKHVYITMNLYPYTTAHLMVVPKRHVLDTRELTDEEILDLNHMVNRSMSVIEELYHPSGFNVGYNMRAHSGASIPHLHCHVIPRYSNEIGLLELVGGAKVLIEDPRDCQKKLIPLFAKS